MIFYVDGLAGAPLAYDPGFEFTTDLAIGARADTMGNSFWGSIDEPAIFNRALAPGEVAALFASGADGICKPSVLLVAPLSNQTAYPGLDCALNVAAYSSAGPLSYQWRKEGANLDSATNATFVIAGAQATNAGNYDVVVSDTISSVTSSVAVVTLALCGQIPPGLVGWWSGDGHAFDLTGNHNGVFQNGASYAPGVVGQAFDLDGSRYVDLSYWNVGSTWSWCAWVNPSATPAGRLVIAGAANECRDWEITMYDGVFGVVIRQPGGCTQTIFSGITAVPGTWYYIVGVSDGYMAKIYVNGALLGSAPVEPGYAGTSYGPLIGNGFPGLIDEVMLFNRALDADEIAALYATGSAGVCKALAIYGQPQSLITNVTQTTSFSVAADGTGLLGYQWWKETNAIDGATNNVLTLTNLQLSDADNYTVVVGDVSGSVTSSLAVLTLIAPPVITGFTPASGTTNNAVLMTGLNLAGVFQVLFGGANASFVIGSDTNLWVYVPAGATNGTLSVTTLSGTAASPSDFTFANVPCLAPPTGLVGWWPGEGCGDDLISTSHGNLTAGVGFAPGLVGQAFSLDGAQSYVQIPNSSSLSLTGAITVEGWINPQRLQGTIACQYDASTGQCAWWLGVGPSGEVYFEAYADGCAWRQVVTDNGRIAPGVFSHVAGAFDPATQELQIYVNGVPVPVSLTPGSAIVAAIHNSTAPIRLGAYVMGNGQLDYNWMFAGLIDEVSLYARVLGADEIQALFNAGSAGKCKPLDTNAPTVIATAPDYGRLGLPTNTVLTVTFSETMAATTLTSDSCFVTNAASNPVPSTVTYNLANRTATFTPAIGWPDGTNTLTITTGAKDLAGNALAAQFTWSFRANQAALMLTTNVVVDTADASLDGLDLIVNACTVSLNGNHSFDGVLVMNNGTLNLAGGTTLTVAGDLLVGSTSTVVCEGANNTGQVDGQWAGVGVTINADHVVVEAGSKITADSQGYVASTGNGVGPGGPPESCWGNAAGGAGYGGAGGTAQGGCNQGGGTYGSVLEPVDLGSSSSTYNGNWSGSGGGAIRLVVGGSFELQGTVSANGTAPPVYHSAGGSGGSIWVTTSVLRGAGLFQANGANYSGGVGGGGGGGRIAVYYQDASGYTNSAATATGGSGWQSGSPGSVVFMDASFPQAHLWVVGGASDVFAPSNNLHYGAVTLDGGANLIVGAYSTFLVDGALEVKGQSALTLGGGTVLTIDGSLNVTSNSTVICQGANNTGQVNGQWAGVGVTINASNMLVEAGSRITADGQGYVANTSDGVGPGGPAEACWGHGAGGAGYGGAGGTASGWCNLGGATYGSVLEPVDLGSSRLDLQRELERERWRGDPPGSGRQLRVSGHGVSQRRHPAGLS